MTNELLAEERISFERLATDLGVNRRTVARWADLGYGPHRLEHYRIGKKRYSSREAAERFLAAVNSELPSEPAVRS
jgi:hypothetical protein